MNTIMVITSWITLSCPRSKRPKPMRFAGTWKQYSKKAIPQLARIAIQTGFARKSLRWPYQAKVMKTFETRRSRIVGMGR